MSVNVVIPARLASERLPGKPLAEIAGIPMIVRVMQRVQKADVDNVIAAVDDPAVAAVVEAAGFRAALTSEHHQSGSDRVMEVAQQQGWEEDEIVINVQGDEPLIPPAVVDQLAQLLATDAEVQMASLFEPIANPEDFLNPNVVKVVMNARSDAIYFSRSPVPYPRDMLLHAGPDQQTQALDLAAIGAARHIGMYGFRVGALRQFLTLNDSKLERIERLEQLRWLEAGHRLRMLASCEPVPGGVDTPEDLARVEQIVNAQDGRGQIE